MKILYFLIIPAVLGGCSTSPVQTYGDLSLPRDEVALIRASSGEKSNAISLGFKGYQAYLDYGAYDYKKFEKGIWMYPSEIIVLPGKYEFTISCNFLDGGVEVKLSKKIDAGYIYEIECMMEKETWASKPTAVDVQFSQPIPYK